MFSIYFLSQYIESIPRDLEEAARIDGANYFQIYRLVIMPNIKPALASIGILTFLANWNSFLWPLVALSKRQMYTLQLGIANLQGTYITGYDYVLAGSVIAALPMLVVFFLFQRHFVEGIAISGLR